MDLLYPIRYLILNNSGRMHRKVHEKCTTVSFPLHEIINNFFFKLSNRVVVDIYIIYRSRGFRAGCNIPNFSMHVFGAINLAQDRKVP